MLERDLLCPQGQQMFLLGRVPVPRDKLLGLTLRLNRVYALDFILFHLADVAFDIRWST